MTKCKGCLKDALQAAVSDYEAPKGYFSKLSKLVSFRTESQLPERTPILYEYVSNAIGPLFEELGYSLEVFENLIKGFGPILLAERNEGASLTVLGYGHGDVIHGQESQWDNNRNPWKLSFEGDKVYGRETAGSNMTEVIQYDLKIPIVWLPLSYAGCSQHAPNEHIIKPLMREGIRTVTEIYWNLGEENNSREVILTS